MWIKRSEYARLRKVADTRLVVRLRVVNEYVPLIDVTLENAYYIGRFANADDMLQMFGSPVTIHLVTP